MSAHTPGPDFQYCLRFMAELNGQTWITGDDVVCENMRVRAKAVHKHLWGNRKLYDAAPDLLAALVEYTDRHEASCDPRGLPEYDRACAAIAKATGAT